MPNFGATELIILLVVIMVLFGAKRLPDSARSLGRSMRILKAETKGLRDDDDDPPAHRDTTVTAEPLPPVQPVTPPPPPGSVGTPGTAGSGPVAGEQAQHPRP